MKGLDCTTILIGGDIVPTKSNYELFITGNARKLVGEELLELVHAADMSVFNLETPLADEETPIAKCGPNLIAPTACSVGLKAINPGIFSLANNHILDQGEAGLLSTLEVLDSFGSSYFGAGENLPSACRPWIHEANGISIGLYACVEHEFSLATACSPGANPFNSLQTLHHISNLKKQCDYVVVLYHGGKEHYRYPSPRLQERCRRMVEEGADIVICQHSHCVGCEERWLDGTIVYGQGNFLFDMSDDECWQTGLLIEVAFDTTASVKYIPIEKHGACVRMAQGYSSKLIAGSFQERSRQITKPGFVEEEYRRYALANIDGYLSGFVPWSRSVVFRVLNRLLGKKLVRKSTTADRLLAEINHIECEAHRELFIAGLKELHREGEN